LDAQQRHDLIAMLQDCVHRNGWKELPVQ
jgi:hypothetical protein